MDRRLEVRRSDEGWEVYDYDLGLAVFGSDSKTACEQHVGWLLMAETDAE